MSDLLQRVSAARMCDLDPWDRRYYALAEHVASWSKDPRRKVGAALVGQDRRDVSLGCNGLPPGWDDSRMHDREWKNRWVIHAERNALDRARFDAKGATLYVTRTPCTQCASGLISSGVSRVVCPVPDAASSWQESQMAVVNHSGLNFVLILS